MRRDGQPYKFGAQKRTEFLQNLRDGMRRGAAAEAVGVTRETVRLVYRDEPEFASAVEQAEMDANETVEDALYQAATSGNVTAIQVWLYNRQPERWVDKRNVKMEHSGPDGGPQVYEHRVDRTAVEAAERAYLAVRSQSRDLGQ